MAQRMQVELPAGISVETLLEELAHTRREFGR
jgi:hypothetical protein